MINIEKLKITNIHNSLINKEYTCTELIQSYFDKIQKTNKTYNVFSSLCEQEALEKAKNVDEKIDRNKK